MADDRGEPAGLPGGDLSDREGDRGDRPVAGQLAAATSLAATYFGLVWLIAFHCGLDPAVSLGISIGTFVGLASLIMEVAVVGRSMRSVERNGMQATLMTFGIRLGTVAALGGWFLVLAAVDSEAFCLSYFATFFLYMCWLTWRIYNEPVHFDPAKAGRAPAQPAARTTAPARREPVREAVAGGVA